MPQLITYVLLFFTAAGCAELESTAELATHNAAKELDSLQPRSCDELLEPIPERVQFSQKIFTRLSLSPGTESYLHAATSMMQSIEKRVWDNPDLLDGAALARHYQAFYCNYRRFDRPPLVDFSQSQQFITFAGFIEEQEFRRLGGAASAAHFTAGEPVTSSIVQAHFQFAGRPLPPLILALTHDLGWGLDSSYRSGQPTSFYDSGHNHIGYGTMHASLFPRMFDELARLLNELKTIESHINELLPYKARRLLDLERMHGDGAHERVVHVLQGLVFDDLSVSLDEIQNKLGRLAYLLANFWPNGFYGSNFGINFPLLASARYHLLSGLLDNPTTLDNRPGFLDHAFMYGPMNVQEGIELYAQWHNMDLESPYYRLMLSWEPELRAIESLTR